MYTICRTLQRASTSIALFLNVFWLNSSKLYREAFMRHNSLNRYHNFPSVLALLASRASQKLNNLCLLRARTNERWHFYRFSCRHLFVLNHANWWECFRVINNYNYFPLASFSSRGFSFPLKIKNEKRKNDAEKLENFLLHFYNVKWWMTFMNK